jgi:PhnB protein
MLFMYVPDCDAVWHRALDAGAREVVPMADQEWGDRFGQLVDPFGHVWGIATQLEAPH